MIPGALPICIVIALGGGMYQVTCDDADTVTTIELETPIDAIPPSVKRRPRRDWIRPPVFLDPDTEDDQ